MSADARLVQDIMVVMECAFDPAYGEAWNRRQVADALALPSTHALVMDQDGVVLNGNSAGSPAGFVLTRHAADEEELLLIAVIPEARRRGLARRMIEALVGLAKERGTAHIFLEMRRNNPAAHLYRQLGFEPIGERPNYYTMADGNQIDAITFKRAI